MSTALVTTGSDAETARCGEDGMSFFSWTELGEEAVGSTCFRQ